MVRRNSLLVIGTAALAAMGSACGGGGGGGDGGTGDGGGAGMTYTFVVNGLTIDMTDVVSDPHTGFNLDGLCSDGTAPADCSHEDFMSTLDPDQNTDPSCGSTCHNGCVDNQLPTLANTLMTQVDVRAAIADQINTNQLAILAQVSDVNDLTNDPSITVSLFLGYPTRTDNCGMVASGAEYVISQSSLNAGGTTPADAKFHFPGSIVNGRIHVQTMASDTFNLPLPAVGGSMPLSLALHSPQLRANISAGGLTMGNLGGAVNGNELVTTVCAAVPMYCSLAMTALGGLVDIQADGVCYDNTMMPARYGNIGLGLGVSAIPATIRAMNPVVASAPDGTCGASSPDGG